MDPTKKSEPSGLEFNSLVTVPVLAVVGTLGCFWECDPNWDISVVQAGYGRTNISRDQAIRPGTSVK
jgi:hypothetical protein